MLKPILSAIFILCIGCFESNAQSLKGDIYLNGSLDYGNQQVDFGNNESEFSQLRFRPFLGYAITQDLEAGVTGFYTVQRQVQQGQEVRQTSSSTGLYARYKFPLNESRKLIINAQFSIPTIFNSNNINEDVEFTEFNLDPGLTYYVTPRIALEANFGGMRYLTQKDEGNTVNTFETSLFSSSLIGLRWKVKQGN